MWFQRVGDAHRQIWGVKDAWIGKKAQNVCLGMFQVKGKSRLICGGRVEWGSSRVGGPEGGTGGDRGTENAKGKRWFGLSFTGRRRRNEGHMRGAGGLAWQEEGQRWEFANSNLPPRGDQRRWRKARGALGRGKSAKEASWGTQGDVSKITKRLPKQPGAKRPECVAVVTCRIL